jgi:hypothetical protein
VPAPATILTRRDLKRALLARQVLSARDYNAWRAALQPALTRAVESIAGIPLTQMDLPGRRGGGASVPGQAGRHLRCHTQPPDAPHPSTCGTWPMRCA